MKTIAKILSVIVLISLISCNKAEVYPVDGVGLTEDNLIVGTWKLVDIKAIRPLPDGVTVEQVSEEEGVDEDMELLIEFKADGIAWFIMRYADEDGGWIEDKDEAKYTISSDNKILITTDETGDKIIPVVELTSASFSYSDIIEIAVSNQAVVSVPVVLYYTKVE